MDEQNNPILLKLKNDFPIKIENTISINDYVPDCTDGKTYRLQSIVHHLGSASGESGHYVTNAIRGNKWFTFNDSKCFETSIDDIITDERKQKSAYLLMYKLED